MPNASHTINASSVDGSTNVFNIPFSYINESHLIFYVDGVVTTDSASLFTATVLTGGTTVQIVKTSDSSNPNNVTIKMLRNTPIDNATVVYSNSSTLKASDLNTNTNQFLFAVQEAADDAALNLSLDGTNNFNAQNKRIQNVLDPTDAQDAATKAFVDSTLSNNAAQAAAAAASQAAAAVSETNSANSATASAVSATEAANEVAILAPRYKFSATTTVADPGVSFLRFNNSVASAATMVIINEKTFDSGTPDIEDWIKSWDDSTSTVKGYIRIVEPSTQNYAIYNVLGLTDRVGHVELLCDHVDSHFIAGTTFNEDTSLRITFSRTGDLGQVGATGPVGATGAQGVQGPAATINVGTTTTGAAGSAASVVNSGTTGAAVFDFSVPAGATGPSGATGSAASVSVGNVATGAPGSVVTVTNTGTSSNAVLDFSIPQGATGASGSGSGDVTSSVSSTVDNRLVRTDGTTGKTIQDSNVLLSDAGILSATGLTLSTDLSVLHGGTGQSSHTLNGVLIGNATGDIQSTTAGSAGQVLTANSSGAPTFQNAASGGGPGLDGGTAGEESLIRLNANQLSGNAALTITTGNNGMTAGPLSITNGSSITIQSGATWHLIGA